MRRRIKSDLVPILLWAAAALVVGVIVAADVGVAYYAIGAPCLNATLPTGASFGLPNCRAYEQVSPVDKNGFDAVPMGGLPAQAAAPRGESSEASVAYMGLGSFAGLEGGEPSGSEFPNAYVSSRGAGGWRTRSVSPPTLQATPPGGYFLGYDFSADLSQVVIRVPLQVLTPDAPPDVFNLYIRRPDGSYSLVTTAPPAVSPSNCSECFLSAFAGASSDFSHVIFEANDSLTPGAPGEGVENLYESYEALPGQPREVRLVGILPDGVIAASGSTPGAGLRSSYSAPNRYQNGDVNHAISQDGSRVLFEATADAGGPDRAQSGLTELYDRISGSQTIEISAPVEGATPSNTTAEPARFWAASADGSLVFFTSSAELTTQSNTGTGNASQDLYRYDVHTGTLTDLTIDSNHSDASSGAGVQGVVGASEDGSYVYFVAKGQLVPGDGTDGQPNLYVSHEGELSFIATLNEAGEPEEGDSSDWTSTPAGLQAYVTPDGRYLAFMSVNSLTGYDNIDQSTGKPDHEVYEYSVASAGEAGRLACASCDPSGAQPVGSAFIGALVNEEISTPFHQPRALSDNGTRLFFSSPDRLVPGLASSHVKVFEYENGGIHLISGAANSENDVFLDASPSGKDVFFATRSQLALTDRDNLVDVYDARVDGGFPSPTPLASCVGSACQSPPGAPPSLLAPSSASFTGSGNLAAPATPTVKAKRPKVTRRSKSRKRIRRKAKGRRSRARMAPCRCGQWPPVLLIWGDFGGTFYEPLH